jgi:hypothetical protein
MSRLVENRTQIEASMPRIQMLSTVVVLLAVASVAEAQGRGRGRGEEKHEAKGEVVRPDEQQKRILEEQRRANDYQRHLDDEIREQQHRQAELEAQRRAAQIRAQHDYAEQLARQQQALRAQRDYARDTYITAPNIYRYRMGSAYRETSQYGADVLRQAVNDGYRQGYRSGGADRADGWRPDYSRSPAYLEATYGYSGRYVDQSDYSYYFRQGFQRGYNDGYYSRLQYGQNLNGTASILSNILSGILGLTRIR